MTGTIGNVRVDKGFGFIKDDGRERILLPPERGVRRGHRQLREGDSVEFEVGQGPKGPRAENVRRTST